VDSSERTVLGRETTCEGAERRAWTRPRPGRRSVPRLSNGYAVRPRLVMPSTRSDLASDIVRGRGDSRAKAYARSQLEHKPLPSLEEAAVLLGRSRSTFYRSIDKGDLPLPLYRIAGRYCIPRLAIGMRSLVTVPVEVDITSSWRPKLATSRDGGASVSTVVVWGLFAWPDFEPHATASTVRAQPNTTIDSIMYLGRRDYPLGSRHGPARPAGEGSSFHGAQGSPPRSSFGAHSSVAASDRDQAAAAGDRSELPMCGPGGRRH
jgi:excisionase family DNA binding protein